ncbi:uncharacterized protein BO95DRAFT_88548 [Aspergillus brunneoviolaceus CBS 621.78]|uniref:Uncharacterized protein n=1 Tax=Aspergillus brunneoviolaceus CBS 621.78 TaxID=1450534 RepID=A0ACD1GDK5_9EURO|nr:hypothetical protein BO95DRAFT_88548 [Aspergillus brunneoviolaceus CBS 621.78]RAH47307.1 hypothetical protein BO95DRAFT_88548 [Aspergillus brunneoviolaceus CBS 621.78]
MLAVAKMVESHTALFAWGGRRGRALQSSISATPIKEAARRIPERTAGMLGRRFGRNQMAFEDWCQGCGCVVSSATERAVAGGERPGFTMASRKLQLSFPYFKAFQLFRKKPYSQYHESC